MKHYDKTVRAREVFMHVTKKNKKSEQEVCLFLKIYELVLEKFGFVLLL